MPTTDAEAGKDGKVAMSLSHTITQEKQTMKSKASSRAPRCIVEIVFFLLLALPIAGCSSSREAPYPSDQSLIKTFQENREAFTRILSNFEDKALHTQLGIRRVLSIGMNPKHIMLEVWFHDFPGPGGATKGYAYQEKAPSSDLLVDSIDRHTNPPISPEEKTLIRRIEGNWYLYFHSSH